MRLRTHDVRDVEPLLIAVAGLDHAQHEHGGADVQRSPARIIERSIAFWRIVDDNHDFRRMSRLVAAALLGHRLPRPPPDRILLRRFCGVPPPSSSWKNMWASWIIVMLQRHGGCTFSQWIRLLRRRSRRSSSPATWPWTNQQADVERHLYAHQVAFDRGRRQEKVHARQNSPRSIRSSRQRVAP